MCIKLYTYKKDIASCQAQSMYGSLPDVYSGVWLPRIQSSSHRHETTVNGGGDPLHVLVVSSAAQLHGMKRLVGEAVTVLLQVQSSRCVIFALIHLIPIKSFLVRSAA